MSRQLGSLHRSNSHPANLQTPIPIIPLFAFPPHDFPIINIPSSTNSDTNSDISVLGSISQFYNSNVETPDEFADSEPSPSNYTQTNSSVFSKPRFQPIPSNHPLLSISAPSYASQVTPTYSSLHSDRSYNNSPDTPQISQELDNFITLQQQLIYPNTLTIHQLSSTLTSSTPPTPTLSSAYSIKNSNLTFFYFEISFDNLKLELEILLRRSKTIDDRYKPQGIYQLQTNFIHNKKFIYFF